VCNTAHGAHSGGLRSPTRIYEQHVVVSSYRLYTSAEDVDGLVSTQCRRMYLAARPGRRRRFTGPGGHCRASPDKRCTLSSHQAGVMRARNVGNTAAVGGQPTSRSRSLRKLGVPMSLCGWKARVSQLARVVLVSRSVTRTPSGAIGVVIRHTSVLHAGGFVSRCPALRRPLSGDLQDGRNGRFGTMSYV
jgi:hypothetical protein